MHVRVAAGTYTLCTAAQVFHILFNGTERHLDYGRFSDDSLRVNTDDSDIYVGTRLASA